MRTTPREPGRRRLSFEALEPRRTLAANYLDPGFGTGGYLAIDAEILGESRYGLGAPIDSDLHVLPTGRLLVVTEYRLAQFFGDGVLDTTFGNGGAIDSDVVGPQSGRAASRVLPNGKFLYIQDGEIFHRFLSNGRRDNSFSEDAMINFPASAAELVNRKEGGFVAAYGFYDTVQAGLYLVLAGLKEDGSPDPSFGNSGFASVEWPAAEIFIRGLIVRRDGKILAAVSEGLGQNVSLLQFNPNGSLDESFGEGGIAQTPLTVSWELTDVIQERSDGAIVVAGAIGSDVSKIQIAALNSDGSKLVDFGNDGVVDTGLKFPDSDYSRDNYLALDGEDRLVVVGEAGGRTRLKRFLADGSLDLAFSTGGTTALQTHLTSVPAVAVSDTGDVFLLARNGSGILKIQGDPNDAGPACPTEATEAVSTVSSDELSGDETWYLLPGAERLITTNVAGREFKVSVPPRLGEISIGPSCRSLSYRAPESIGTRDQFTITVSDDSGEYNATIQVVVGLEVHDDQFQITSGQDHTLNVLDNDTFVPEYNRPKKITAFNAGDSESRISEDGTQILFQPASAATCGDSEYELEYTVDWATIARVRVNYSNPCPLPDADSYLNTKFGEQGFLAIDDFQHSAYGSPPPDANVHVLSDGKLLVVTQYQLARYLRNGEPDPTFGDLGISPTGVVGPPNVHTLSSVLPDGTIFYRQDSAALHRFSSNGTRDIGFDPNAFLSTLTQWGPGPASLTQATDGSFFIAFMNTTVDAFVRKTNLFLVRLTNDGTPDVSWGSGGVKIIPWSHSHNVVAMSWTADEKLLLATEKETIVKGWDIGAVVLARLNSDGTLDDSFGNAGIVDTSLTGRNVSVSLTLRHDGSFILSGADASGDSNTIQLAAYSADGTLLSDFANNGLLDTELSASMQSYPLDDYLAIDATGRIFVIGQSAAGEISLLRLRPDGSLDRDFSNGATAAIQLHFSDLPTLDVSGSGELFLLARDASALLNLKSEPGFAEATAEPQAINDRIRTVSTESVEIPVLANDIVPESDANVRIYLPQDATSNGSRLQVTDDGQSVVYFPSEHIAADPRWIFSITDSFSYGIELDGQLSTGNVVIDVDLAWDWHLEASPKDVDGDGVLVPADALVLINLLNQLGAGSIPQLEEQIAANVDAYLRFLGVADFVGDPPPYAGPRRSHADVDNDGFIAPMDALLVINTLNALFAQVAANAPEGEANDANLVANRPVVGFVIAPPHATEACQQQDLHSNAVEIAEIAPDFCDAGVASEEGDVARTDLRQVRAAEHEPFRRSTMGFDAWYQNAEAIDELLFATSDFSNHHE